MKSWRWHFGKVVPYTILTIIALIFILPLIWVIVASLDPNAMQSIKAPDSLTIQNYINVLTEQANQRAFGVGLIISLGQALAVVLIAGLAAYPLSRYEMRYNNMLMYTILFMTALPITAVMVPVYQLFLSLNLLDSIFGLILFLTASSLPYGIWMMKNFMDSVPIELEEAAWVDGATTLQTIWHIVSPLMFPGICVVGIFTFSGSWGNFFVPYILLNTVEKYPASVQLYSFFGQHGMVAYGELAAYSVLYAVPSILLYILSQKYMSKGFSMQGAAKG